MADTTEVQTIPLTPEAQRKLDVENDIEAYLFEKNINLRVIRQAIKLEVILTELSLNFRHFSFEEIREAVFELGADRELLTDTVKMNAVEN